jgi:hypothetical protein
MSTDPKPATPVELEAEGEVDFGRYARRIAAHWWLLLVGALIGALLGFLVSLSHGKHFKATAQVYLGQPLAPDSAAPVSTPPTTLGLVQAFVTSEEAVDTAAAAADLKPGKLRNNITARPIPGASTTRQAVPAPLLAISVTGASRSKTALAANSLAEQAIARVGAYTKTKIETLEAQLKYIDVQLQIVDRRLSNARARQADIIANNALSPTEKLVSLTSINSDIDRAESRQASLELNRFNTRRAISLAQDIEATKITADAVAVKSEPTSARTSVIVGAFIGFLLGIVAALLWDRFAGRFGSGSGQPATA